MIKNNYNSEEYSCRKSTVYLYLHIFFSVRKILLFWAKKVNPPSSLCYRFSLRAWTDSGDGPCRLQRQTSSSSFLHDAPQKDLSSLNITATLKGIASNGCLRYWMPISVTKWEARRHAAWSWVQTDIRADTHWWLTMR